MKFLFLCILKNLQAIIILFQKNILGGIIMENNNSRNASQNTSSKNVTTRNAQDSTRNAQDSTRNAQDSNRNTTSNATTSNDFRNNKNR